MEYIAFENRLPFAWHGYTIWLLFNPVIPAVNQGYFVFGAPFIIVNNGKPSIITIGYHYECFFALLKSRNPVDGGIFSALMM